MTSLWFVVFIFGHAGMIFGPLPYDMEECHRRQAGAAAEINQVFEKKDFAIAEGKRVYREDVTMRCISTAKHPRLGDSEAKLGERRD